MGSDRPLKRLVDVFINFGKPFYGVQLITVESGRAAYGSVDLHEV